MKKFSLVLATMLLVASGFAQRDGFDRQGNVNVEDQYADLMEIESGGVFRGVNFDMSKSAVKSYELERGTTSVYQDEEDDELIITTDMGTDILNFADVTYKFDEKGLYHIKVETYGTDADAVGEIYDMIKNHYTQKFGAGVLADDGYLEFYGKNRSQDYTVAIENPGYEGSPGLYLYFYLGDSKYGAADITEQFEDLMEIESGGVFRGINFDMSKDAVLDVEMERFTTSVYEDEEEFELVITTDMGEEILNFADITYKFDEKGLYHIKVETYATDAVSADKVFQMVSDYYTGKLGEGVYAEDGYLEFYGTSRSYDYTVAIENLGYEDSPGMYMYIYVN